MKLSLQGHTIVIASGDYGVAGHPGDGSSSGCLSGYGQNQTIFNAPYPNGCPWVTSVGGSMVEPDKTVRDHESAFQVCSPVSGNCYSSTGGFSNYFTRPAYQETAIAKWLAYHDPGYPTYLADMNASNIGEGGGIYNRAGRAVPDVAANAANMLLYIGGEPAKLYGTSLAAPIWGSIITLINQQRTIAGKGPVGFLNPVLYTNPWALERYHQWLESWLWDERIYSCEWVGSCHRSRNTGKWPTIRIILIVHMLIILRLSF